MTNITVDFQNTCGPIKAMNGVNNGPIASSVRKTSAGFTLYKDLEIPFARLHDASFFEIYGGEYVVDVHRIFPDFDADENDPASYLFGPTDLYIATVIDAGTKPFYRLGASIEHGHKVGTQVPKDFAKWARICEHIIKHYNEGWADGFNHNIEYWEIWNEPECRNWDGSNPCWQGTDEEFFDFYEVVAKHLKKCFPSLKIGGPAFCGMGSSPLYPSFCKRIQERNVPIDFYSFHMYLKRPDDVFEDVKKARAMLEKYGINDVELYIDEWNYVRAWSGDDYEYSMLAQKGIKGSSIVAGAMCAGQASELDGLMYYNVVGDWSGIFTSSPIRTLKTYHTFEFFRNLKRLGTQLKTEYKHGNIYNCAATDGENSAIMITNYSEHDTDLAEDVTINLENLNTEKGFRVKVYKLDDIQNGELVFDEPYKAWEKEIRIHLDLFTTCYIEIIPEK